MIILVAFLANNVTTLICTAIGLSRETTEMVAIAVMVIAALIVYTRMTKNQRRQ